MNQASYMSYKKTADDALRETRWLHLCNGLVPARDGGMVPSILGMTQSLARLGEDVTILTPTPSQLNTGTLDPHVALKGPETNLECAVRSAHLVHIHGLWQGHIRRGAREARIRRVPYLITRTGWQSHGLYVIRGGKRDSILHSLSRETFVVQHVYMPFPAQRSYTFGGLLMGSHCLCTHALDPQSKDLQ